MADQNLIGHGVCPVCGNNKARFTVSKKSLACMTCNACNTQIFTRSDLSDEKLRTFIRTPGTAAVRDAAPVAPVAAPVAPVAAPVAPVAAPVAAVAAPVAAKPETKTTKPGPGWGLLGAWHG